MGLKLAIGENENHLGIAFPNAYWALDNIAIGESNGIFGVSIVLRAYPSRESRKKTEANGDITSNVGFGGATIPYYNGVIYEFRDFVAVNTVYPNGVPSTLDGLKQGAYIYLKDYFQEIPFEDVFENQEQGLANA